MNIVILSGVDLDADRLSIMEKINSDSIFVLDSEKALYQYIDELKIANNFLFHLKICNELHDLDVDYDSGSTVTHVRRFSELLKLLTFFEESYVTVKGDLCEDEKKRVAVRTQLSHIVQQLVYLGIPLELVQVMTEREHRNIEKIKKYEKEIPVLEENLKKSYAMLDTSKFSEFTDIYDQVASALNEISKSVEESKSNEMLIAVAASKKTGKSVIVNSMIEEELAPTSLELATPNNCIYTHREKGGYSLSYKDGTTGNQVHQEFSSSSQIRELLGTLFKQAEMDHEKHFTIPDMKIGYTSTNNRLSHYTIYDTPGPDLAGAIGHKNAAERAMNCADVIVFTIDYSKYLTESELEYLQQIKTICDSKKKFYSLIFVVNKLDLRYDSEGDKSIARILDFIRSKLIAIDPQFCDCIVMGTSALTYFNCITVVKLNGCACLSEPTGFQKNLVVCRKAYQSTNQMTVLGFVRKMSDHMLDFHGIEIESLEELIQSSGMPNLLNYIGYVARDKARIERVDNLLFHIDASYKKIQNLFRFQELEDALAANEAGLAQAIVILTEFTDKVDLIFNESYLDVKKMMKDCTYTSTAIGTVGTAVELNNMDFRISMIKDYFIRMIEDSLDPDAIAKYIAFEERKEAISSKLTTLYQSSTVMRKIEGTSKKVVEEEKISACIEQVLENLTQVLCQYINDRFNELWDVLSDENSKIQNDFETLLNNRIRFLNEAIEECKQRLDCECQIPFNLETPAFKFAFQRGIGNVQKLTIEMNAKTLSTRMREDLNKIATQKNINFSGMFRKFFFAFKNTKNINQICYDQGYLMRELYEKNLKWEIKSQIERAEIGKTYEQDKDNLETEVKNFLQYVQSEVADLSQMAFTLVASVKCAIDRTPEYAANIQELEQKKQCLQHVETHISDFRTTWLSIIND